MDTAPRDASYASSAQVIHARRGHKLAALCGASPGSPWTTTRSYVTCVACKEDIARRLGARGGQVA